jgi:hypothetical protein
MKVNLNWLKQYVDFDWLPEELTGRSAILGLPGFAKQRILSS